MPANAKQDWFIAIGRPAIATLPTVPLAVRKTVSTGYKLYIPTGVKQVSDKNFNQKLKIRDRYVYLYVDTISYYYKNTLNYKKSEEYNYYYKEIKLSTCG